jgi:hypothetical protein
MLCGFYLEAWYLLQCFSNVHNDCIFNGSDWTEFTIYFNLQTRIVKSCKKSNKSSIAMFRSRQLHLFWII